MIVKPYLTNRNKLVSRAGFQIKLVKHLHIIFRKSIHTLRGESPQRYRNSHIFSQFRFRTKTIFRPLQRGRPCLQESQGRKEACQGLRICPHRKRDRHSDNVSQIYFLWQGRPFVKIYKHIISQLANFVKLFIVKTGIKTGEQTVRPQRSLFY